MIRDEPDTHDRSAEVEREQGRLAAASARGDALGELDD